MKKNKKGFTLVELLAVIVILAIILVIAVPKIMDTINQSRLSSIESSARVLLRSAKDKLLTKTLLGNDNTLSCDDLSDDLSEFDFCSVTFNKEEKPYIALRGSKEGKFSGYYCEGTEKTLMCKRKDKDNALVTFKLVNNNPDNISYLFMSKYFFEVNKGEKLYDSGCVEDYDNFSATCALNDGTNEISKVDIEYIKSINTFKWTYINDESPAILSSLVEINEDLDLNFTIGGCVAKGTKISLSDGTYKNVEDITFDDTLLVYDFFTGKMEEKEIISIFKGTLLDAYVLDVKLDNGSFVKIIAHEAVFDMTSKSYFEISIGTYKDAIGKTIMTLDNGLRGSAKIVDIVVSKEDVEYYELYTNSSLNFIANNIVLSANNEYFKALYTIDDDYKIDMDKLNQDILEYGYYTYDELSDVINEDEMDYFNFKYLKKLVAQGYLTEDELKENIKLLIKESRTSKELYK